MARSCFFLAKGMADGSLGKEIQLKSISDGVVFCHPIIPKGPHFRVPQNHHRMSRFTTPYAPKTGHRVRSKNEGWIGILLTHQAMATVFHGSPQSDNGGTICFRAS